MQTNGEMAPLEAPEMNAEAGTALDIRKMFETIGEYEIVKRLMADDIATLQRENAELKRRIAELEPAKKAVK